MNHYTFWSIFRHRIWLEICTSQRDMVCCACDDSESPETGAVVLQLDDSATEDVLQENRLSLEEVPVTSKLSETSTDPLPFLSQDLDSRYVRQDPLSPSLSIDMAVVSQRITKTDTEILRGIRLCDTLKDGGRLWRCNPMNLSPDARSAMFQRSRPVPSLDVFLSHTWCSRGISKILALLLQSAWPNALVFYAFGVALALVLCVTDVLPLPFQYNATTRHGTLMCPVGPWVAGPAAAGPWRGQPRSHVLGLYHTYKEDEFMANSNALWIRVDPFGTPDLALLPFPEPNVLRGRCLHSSEQQGSDATRPSF
eukprot:Skav209933  [mRNA]  locus=scaffold102:94013:97488:+ [translate_table: standard]